MKEKITKIFKDNRTTRSQIGISKGEFYALLPTFAKVELEDQHKRKVGINGSLGGRPSVLETSAHKLFFILYYCKVYPSYDEGGVAWGVHRSMIGNWVQRYLPLLQESLRRLGTIPPETGEEFNKRFGEKYERKYIFIDGSERQVTRSTDYQKQKKYYSGKKNFIQ